MSSSSSRYPNHSIGASRRPASIAELADIARDGACEEGQELKYYLRVAEKYRRKGKEYVEAGDLESAFIEYAKAATVVLERLPKHRDYHTLLTTAQRQNLGLVCTFFFGL
jgi:hypothetical protein